MIRLLCISLAALLSISAAAASPDRKHDKRQLYAGLDSLGEAYLDTVNIKKKVVINDYSTIGFHYSYSLVQTSFNPPKKNVMMPMPVSFGITWTQYCKMFGYMPYFGLKLGVLYLQDGYKFKQDREGGYSYHVDGCVKAVYDLAEFDALANFHLDFWHMRVLVDLGPYVGYRLKVKREFFGPNQPIHGEYYDQSIYDHKFYPHDNRLDYGLKGGAGFAFVFDPIEIQISAHYKYGFGSLYKADYNSPYYYRFASPTDIIISAGVYFQLTKRTGKTNAQLRRQARESVFPKNTGLDEIPQSIGR